MQPYFNSKAAEQSLGLKNTVDLTKFVSFNIPPVLRKATSFKKVNIKAHQFFSL